MIARSRKPGHFVIVICDEKGERIPLTIADADEARGTITLIVQAVGESTRAICAREAGEYLRDGGRAVGALRPISPITAQWCVVAVVWGWLLFFRF